MTIEDRVKKIIARVLKIEVEQIKNKASLRDDLGADSINLAELVLSMEDEFHIEEIPEEDQSKLVTVQNIIDYLTEKQQ
ncbi:MAG: acyl carrier protein [Desulfobacterales bacterium]|nr:acyl carrier protein [Desulfobacterales bacterium]